MKYRFNLDTEREAEMLKDAIESTFNHQSGVYCDESQIEDGVLIVQGLTKEEAIRFATSNGWVFEIEEYDAINDDWEVIYDFLEEDKANFEVACMD